MAGLLFQFLFIGLQLLSFLRIANAVPLDSRTNAMKGHPPPGPPVNVVAQLIGTAVDMTVMGNGTYPRANLLADGSLIATYTSFPKYNHRINVIKSRDGGASWQEVGIVTEGPSNATDIDNPYILELPSGRLLVAIRNHSKDPVSGNYTSYRISVFSSEDGGRSWKWLSEPASDPAGPNGNWEPFLRNAIDGSLQIYWSRETSGVDQDTYMKTSRDGGLTWSPPNIVSGTGVTSRDGMFGIATISHSSLIAVFESNATAGNGLFTIDSVRSSDDGRTWGGRSRVYTPSGVNNNAGAPQIINVGGVLICSFMTDEDTNLHDWFEGSDVKIVVSVDGGLTWSPSSKTTIFPVFSLWSGMVTLDDKNFLVMADHFGVHSQKVALA